MTSFERRGILAGGVWLIDSTKYIDRYPEPSRLATVSEVVRSNGGGAFNLLVDLAKLGADFPLAGVGSIGDDVAGDWIQAQCRQHGIDSNCLYRRKSQATAATDVMTEVDSGRRTFFYQPGANRDLFKNNFPLAKSSARILYLGYPGLLPGLDCNQVNSGRTGVVDLLDEAQRTGFVTAVDLVSAETSDWPGISAALPYIDLLFLNEWEAAKLLQLESLSDEAVTPAMLHEYGRALLVRGVRQAVIIHCSRGALCVAKTALSVRLGTVNVSTDELRGTCGAGDALAAGFLLGFHRGLDWKESLELAVCAAATCLHDLTSSGGVRLSQECLEYGRQRGFREFS